MAPSSSSSFHGPKRRDVRDGSTCLAACFNRNNKPWPQAQRCTCFAACLNRNHKACPQAQHHHSTATIPSSSSSSFHRPKLRDVRQHASIGITNHGPRLNIIIPWQPCPQAHHHHSTAPSSEMYLFGSMLQSESQTMPPSSSSSLFHMV